MARTSRKIVIIGGGIAGLCAAVYGQKCSYDVEVMEQHDNAGGLATSWRRGDYIFETCLHWLLGANPERGMHALWREVFDIDRLNFLHPEVFARIEIEHGEFLDVYANVERMEEEFLNRAPQDATEIRRFSAAVRRFTNFELPDPSEPWPRNWTTLARMLPYLQQIRRGRPSAAPSTASASPTHCCEVSSVRADRRSSRPWHWYSCSPGLQSGTRGMRSAGLRRSSG